MEPESTQEQLDLKAELMARVGGDTDLLHQLCELFMTEQPRLQGLIDAALQAGNVTELARTAHQYRGILLNLGAVRAGQLAGDLEHTTRTGTLEQAQAIAHALATEVTTFRPLLESVALLPQASGKRHTTTDGRP